MPMRIPADAKKIRDTRVTLIRVITTLHDRLLNGDDGLKAKLKATMRDKDAAYAESDLAVATLRAGSVKGTIDPHRVYKLIAKKKLTVEQFLDCVTVRKEPLKEFLPGALIDEITVKTGEPDQS